MEQDIKKRVRRSQAEITQDKINKLQNKIADYKNKISEAEKEIEALKNPPPAAVKKKDVWNKADEYGITPEELMKLVVQAGKKKTKE